MSQVVSYVLQLTALPVSAESYFMQASGQDRPLRAYERTLIYRDRLNTYMNQMSEEERKELFVQMLNQGNLLEIAAEAQYQQKRSGVSNGAWKQIADAVLKILTTPFLNMKRIAISRVGATDQAQQIEQAKQTIAQLYPDIDPADILFDAVSYKLPMSLSECFVQKYPETIGQLSQADLAIMDNIERDILNTILSKCNEFRIRTETYADDFFPDKTIYLELLNAGFLDHDYENTLRRIGVPTLIHYVDQMQGAFAVGQLPGALPPIRIYGAHDYPSMLELNSAITTLAEQQILQQENMMDEYPYAQKVVRQTGGSDDWAGARSVGTSKHLAHWQENSVGLKEKSAQGQKSLAGTLWGGRYDRPETELKNQIAGGANTLEDQLDLVVGGGVKPHDEASMELLKQQLSLLLACIRIRLDAVQDTTFELVQQDDFNHLELVKVLSNLVIKTGANPLHDIALMLQQTYSEGHNKSKFSTKLLPQELVDGVKYQIAGRVKTLLRTVPLFDRDVKEGGSLSEAFMNCALKACVFKNRWEMDLQRRVMQRQTIIDSVNSL